MALIYDVGLNNGDDTAFYLAQGHSVVGIEADPQLVVAARLRFKDAIEAGTLQLLNVAVADRAGEVDFWISEHDNALSSVDPEIAGRYGAKTQRVRVKTARLAEIMEEFGWPAYVKLDIEGSDYLCIQDIRPRPPQYISVETECESQGEDLTRAEYLRCLHLLRDCGYRRFKLISQYDFCPLYKLNVYQRANRFAGAIRASSSRRYRLARALGGSVLGGALDIRGKLERRNHWKFPLGSSGPWGEGTVGKWLAFSEAEETYEQRRTDFVSRRGSPEDPFWCDWHAKI